MTRPTDTEMVLVEFAIPVSLYSIVEDMADEIVFLRARLAVLTYAADTMISWQGTHRECDAWDKLRAAVAAETWRGAHRSPQVIRRGRSER